MSAQYKKIQVSDAVRTAAHQRCSLERLPLNLVLAIIMVESSGDTYAWNPEPKYRYLWDVARKRAFRTLTPTENWSETPPADFPVLVGDRDAEWWGQQASWGLMQVMGAVAREYGFDKHFPALADITAGISVGCRHLGMLHGRYINSGGWPAVVAAYNAGSPRYVDKTGTFINQSYVDKVASYGGLEGLQ